MYFNKRDLLSHLKIHTGEKPNKCELCERAFRRIDIDRKQMREHTEVKPI